MKTHKPTFAGPYMDDDKIDEKVFRMVDHLDRLLAGGQIDRNTYNEAMLDLSKWANSKRRLINEQSET